MSSEPASPMDPRGYDLRVLDPHDPLFQYALALVLTGRHGVSTTAETQIRTLRRAVELQGLKMDMVVAALERERLVTAALAIESPGRTALVYTPPGTESSRRPQVLTEVLGHLARVAAAARVNLLQALLGTDDNGRAEAHAAAGYLYLAELIYLERSTAVPDGPQRMAASDAPLKLVTYTPRRRRLFCEALAATYEQSLDCPKLNGLRSLDDVLEGHMATGLFEPAGWTVAMWGNEPGGVMLTALLPSRTAVEVVYMGVAPRARGQGVGNVLMATALGYARSVAAPTLSLAVDSTNAPARRLYARWNLHETTRRRAWIAPLASAP
ncbi:MAG: GNAT family N-acetyltransferase [Phycisphaerales bacterium]|nr:GNAT family N-acetyltransferase [Phycisphaerales bacterium]